MWWKKPYINRRDWILENLGVLNLTAHDTVILLLIDYMNVNNLPIDPAQLASRSGFDLEKVDEAIQRLAAQNILTIVPSSNQFHFSIDNLFMEGLRYEYVDENIFQVFESELARPLSQQELERLNSWLGMYSQDEIIAALRTAIVYKKVSFPYMNTILANNRKEKGL